VLRNKHFQTIWSQKIRRLPVPQVVKKRLELPDGDFLDLAWAPSPSNKLVLIMHGLGGSIHSTYARGLMQTLAAAGWQAVLMHSRGCSGEPNRKHTSYHAGYYEDLLYTIDYIKKNQPDAEIHLIGISLGGSAILNMLGRANRADPAVRSAIAVSVPYLLEDAAIHLNKGLSRLYQAYLLRCSKWLTRAKSELITPHVSIDLLKDSNTFRSFDDNFTAPLHGFKDATEYYDKCSALQHLQHIEIPTLLIHAADDPFMSHDSIPTKADLSPAVELEVRKHGGHVGFIEGSLMCPHYWMEERVIQRLNQLTTKP
jgi:predicted alpha/beta-fold hydrolase